ncbi:RluA family pseudouridine synthase [soil metagenome]
MSHRPLILHEDAHLLVVDKPAGLLTQGYSQGEPTLERALRSHLLAEAPASGYLGTVHRLDRPVSGVMVWAKTPKAARRLCEQFARRVARKQYWAVVEALPKDRAGIWDDWLCEEDTGLGVVQICLEIAPRARHARTRYALGTGPGLLLPPGCAWLKLWPETGRTHQLRVQASSRGLPILGDSPYQSRRPFGPGIALHARSLSLQHPISRQEMTFEAELPTAWAEQGIRIP